MRPRLGGGRSATTPIPCEAITAIRWYIAPAPETRVRIAPAGMLKYSRRSPRRRERRMNPADSRACAAPLIAPRLARRSAASSAAVCSAGSQMSSQASIRPAIGVMLSDARYWPISSTKALSRSFMPLMLVRFRTFSQY